jgi:(p)ppGpp synthase/HD superfamily hydrolase
MVRFKTELLNENIKFKDGHPFAGSSFDVDDLNTPQTYENQISIRFINNIGLLDEIINSLRKKTKEIYQFYQTCPVAVGIDVINIQMKVENISYIKAII